MSLGVVVAFFAAAGLSECSFTEDYWLFLFFARLFAVKNACQIIVTFCSIFAIQNWLLLLSTDVNCDFARGGRLFASLSAWTGIVSGLRLILALVVTHYNRVFRLVVKVDLALVVIVNTGAAGRVFIAVIVYG